jgi:DNA phosphorothioation system restriction enzyme
MPLPDIDLKLSYRSGENDLIQEFLTPCLRESVLYQRAAGYFTSMGLALAARGVADLASRGGRMQLVVSPYLEADDVAALQKAISQPKDILQSIASKGLQDLESEFERNRLNALAWLAATGLLEIRIALRVNNSNEIKRGLYHEKIGIFNDDDGNSVAFSGSSNETAGGLLENFESIEVFCSWRGDAVRIENKQRDFEALWNNETVGLHIIEFSDAAAEILERFRDPDNPPEGIPLDKVHESKSSKVFTQPRWLELRDYQENAIKAWAKNGGKGILAMATGAGKTLTALSLAARVAEKNTPLVIVILCPFINLCNQWLDEVAKFNLKAIACFEGRNRWEHQLNDAYLSMSAGLTPVIAIVTTNRTYQTDSFQAQLRKRIGVFQHLLIADEVHNLGAKKIKDVLHEQIHLRVGLSATPERHHDPEGTETLFNYFGGIIFEYSIDRAIAEGRLCNYVYHPHVVQLTDDEANEYQEITEKLSRLVSYNNEDSELGQAAMSLLIRRSRLLASAENKLSKLDEVLKTLPEKPKKALFYCGDGRTNDPIAFEERRQIEAVARLLGEQHDLRVRNFTYKESSDEREGILRDLGSGFLDGVVAIRCLDEGIDLPDLRMGFLLASSTNPRQFVQRRGRLLRHAPGKDLAIIHDFIIEPPDFGGSQEDTSFKLERRLFQRELKRILDFCNTADNGQSALNSLKGLRSKYNVIAS